MSSTKTKQNSHFIPIAIPSPAVLAKVPVAAVVLPCRLLDRMYFCALHCNALHCAELQVRCLVHCTALLCTALHCTEVHFTTHHFTSAYFIGMLSILLYCTAPDHISLLCTVLGCTLLRLSVVQCSAVHYCALQRRQCTVPHCSEVP